MSTVTLHTKVYRNFQLKTVEENLKFTLKGLAVEAKICGVTPSGWVQIEVSGEDEKVALLHLANEIGVCPTRLERVEKFLTIKGHITALNKSNSKLCTDIGVFLPNNIDAIISLNHLQAQLVDGRKVAFKKIVEFFGFCEQMPLNVKILSLNEEKRYVEAVLSERQIAQYGGWMKSLLDKLIIVGASLYEVKLALKIAKCDRDVVSIEPLGLFEHAVTCKLGTDAAGLIPKIGKNLRNATFSVFNPRKILEFLGDYLIS